MLRMVFLLKSFILFQIQPIPTEESLQQKLQDKTNWDAFKTMTITKFMLYKKDLHDYASLYYWK